MELGRFGKMIELVRGNNTAALKGYVDRLSSTELVLFSRVIAEMEKENKSQSKS